MKKFLLNWIGTTGLLLGIVLALYVLKSFGQIFIGMSPEYGKIILIGLFSTFIFAMLLTYPD